LTERWTQDVNTLSTSVLRLVEEETSKQNTSEVRAIVSPDMSSLLLNERRIRLNDIEARSNTKVVVISDATRPDSRFEVLRVKDGKIVDPEKSKSSVSAAEQFEKKSKKSYKKEVAAVNIKPSSRPKKGIISKLVNIFSSKETKKIKVKTPPKNFKRPNKKKPYPKNSNRNQNNQNNKNRKDNFDNKKPRKDLKPKIENEKTKESSKSKKVENEKIKVSSKPKKLSRPKKNTISEKDEKVTSNEKLNNQVNKNSSDKKNLNAISQKDSKPEITEDKFLKETAKPKKLSRPKKVDSKSEASSKDAEEKKGFDSNHRATNDPRNKS
jgi:ribonuclease E